MPLDILLESAPRMLAHLADASVRALALALAALPVILARNDRAGLKHAVWTLVLCGMLLMPVATLWLPPLSLRVLSGPAEIAAVPMPESPAGAAAAPVPADAGPSRGPARPIPVWPLAACIVYAAVAASLFARLFLGYRYTRALARNSEPLSDARTAPWAGPAAVRESDFVSVPLTVGWLKPMILLPAEWRTWEDGKFVAVLAHEAAHVRRRDWLITLLASANRCIFWFHPLAWWLERRLMGLAEQACDDASVLATGDREQYARALLDIASAARAARGRLVWEAVAMAQPSQVRMRIERILDGRRRALAPISKRGWAAVLACGLPLLYGAAAMQLEPAAGSGPVQAPPADHAHLLLEGYKLTPDEVEKLEGYLRANPVDIAARTKLISYYLQNAMREPRLRHIFWLLEHQPDAEVLASSVGTLNATVSPLNDAADYERARGLITRQAERFPDNAQVLLNAAAYADPPARLDLLARARRLRPGDERLLSLLAHAYVRVVNLDPHAAAPDQLEISSDAELIGSVGEMLVRSWRGWQEVRARSPGVPEREDLAAAGELGERLLKRAQALQPDNPRWREVYQPAAAPAPPSFPSTEGIQRTRVGGAVQAARILQHVRPEYPPLAQQARIQGAVVFDVLLGADGGVKNMRVVRGHPLLIPAAQAAVRQWVYEPTLMDGQPVEVVTTVEVPFTLDTAAAGPHATPDRPGTVREPAGEQAAGPAALVPATQRIRVGGNVMAVKLVRRVPPAYPEDARQQGIEGTVRLNVTIDREGHVQQAQILDGHPLLAPAASDAVRGWIYEPTLLGGRPVEIVTTVEIPFRLQDR